MKLISKWNGRNFYWIEWDQISEILKVGESYYRTKYVLGEGLKTVGKALKKSEFYF